ncbi:hypothetical protein EV44_g3232 [Erysiphe necator]|uniref:Uncharacterized protein n=1 Tax=Uncinula necator TaxID=52586 RepID=A0A0B1P7H9_UNCNE|nr:hypothetical protein EV44_g3232 [Erysiphe necator]
MSESGSSLKRAHSPISDHERNGNTSTVSPDEFLVISAVEFELLVELKDQDMRDLNQLQENKERLNKVWIADVEQNMPEEKCSQYYDILRSAEFHYQKIYSKLDDVTQKISKLRTLGLSAKKA